MRECERSLQSLFMAGKVRQVLGKCPEGPRTPDSLSSMSCCLCPFPSFLQTLLFLAHTVSLTFSPSEFTSEADIPQ